MLTTVFVVLLLAAGVGAGLYFRVPQKLGLVKSPAEQTLSGMPDREAATALTEDLKEQGFTSPGMSIYVLPIAGTQGNLAFAVLDGSKGFSFPSGQDGDPITDYMKELATGDTAAQYSIERVAVQYRSASGSTLLTMTARTEDVSSFASGTMSREQFLKNMDGRVDWPSFYQEAMRWAQ